MRRATKLGAPAAFCVIAALVLGAALPVTAGAALVKYGEYLETEAEHAAFQAFTACPFGASEELDCSWAQSTYKEQWPSPKVKEEYEAGGERKPPGLTSHFTAGNITVPFKQSILLRGGIGVSEEGDTWFGAQGAETIQPVGQVGQPLNKDVNTSLLSRSELSRYDYYVKVSKETKVVATVELAGPPSAIKVNVDDLLTEQGTAFEFPVKVKLSNGFFGDDCYVGSDASPIVVEFTTGTSGTLQGKSGSTLKQDRNGFIVTVYTDTLVNGTFASPGVEGCGVEGGADAAINSAFGLPSPSGQNTTVLNGTLKLATGPMALEGLEGKI